MSEGFQDTEFRRHVLSCLLKPLVRFCLRRSYQFQEFINILKDVYVNTALEEIQSQGQRVSASKISVMTGLHRNEVTRLRTTPAEVDETEPTSVIGKVIARWRHHPDFSTKAGRPRTIKLQQFHELVELVSKTVVPGSVLFEMKRLGYVEKTSRGLALRNYGVSFMSDPTKGFELIGKDVASLLSAAEENMFLPLETTNSHLRTEYDNVSVAALPEIREWLLNENKLFHRRVRNFLNMHDADTNPEVPADKAGATVVVGGFTHTLPTGALKEDELKAS